MAMSRSRGGMSFTSPPPMAMSPELISSSPAIMRSVVDLPQPEGPTRTTNSWSAMSRSIPFTACTPPSYSLTIFRRCTCAMAGSAFRRAGGQAGDVVVHQERIDDHRRQCGQQRAGHQLAPGEGVAADELGDDADGQRHLVRAGDEGGRVDESGPGHGEGEDRCGDDAG